MDDKRLRRLLPRWLPTDSVWPWLGLLAAVVVVFHGVPAHEFVNFDDPMYLFENGHVTAGFTGAGWWWAWTNKDALQWQPLTWLGHMAVSEWGGMQPAPHLWVNLALHGLNAGLLHTLLRTLTGATGRSFAVALLFAVHPVNVETVAWASQLKSTLSTAFALAGFLAYARHAQGGGRLKGPVSLAALGLSLLAKPMMVSFPLLLALLDRWPLRRLPAGMDWAHWRPWLAGKLPYVLVVTAMVVVTALPWGLHPDLNTVNRPEWARVAAVPCNYVRYLGLLVWPVDLAVLYPERLDYPRATQAGAALLMLGISALAWFGRRRWPALWFGWAWFGITLLPVSGIVRLGPQGIADRYLYVPGIGLLVAAVWLVAEAFGPARRAVSAGLLVGVVLTAGALAHAQTKHWRNSVTLWEHAAAVTAPSAVRHLNLGNALQVAGRDAEADREFSVVIRLEPGNPRPYVNQAVLAQRRGDRAEALRLLRLARELAPKDARICSNLGSLLHDLGQLAEARQLLEQATRLRPDLFEAHLNLGVLLAQTGEFARAEASFLAAVRIRPGNPDAQHNLGLVRREIGNNSVQPPMNTDPPR